MNRRSSERCGWPSFMPPRSLRSGGGGPLRGSIGLPSCQGAIEIERTSINGHAHNGIDAEAVELVNLFLGRHTAGRNEGPACRISYRRDRGQIRALHQSFLVDVGVQKFTAKRFQDPDRLDKEG